MHPDTCSDISVLSIESGYILKISPEGSVNFAEVVNFNRFVL